MRGDRLSIATAFVITALAIQPALAQDSFDLSTPPPPTAKPAPLFINSVEAGFGFQSVNPADFGFYFGRYGGIADQGLFPLFNASVAGRSPWDSSKSTFWSANATLDGANRRAADATFGEQGKWRVGAFYDDFTRYFDDTAKTPFNGAGSTLLSLPSNWFSGASSLAFSNLQADLKPLKLQTQWQTVGGDLVLTPREGYEMRLHFDHRHRDGLQSQSLTFGQEPNFPVGVFFPEPVNYNSDHMQASIGYADRRWQWSASYAFSGFSDGINSVTVQNPYSRAIGFPGWPAGAFAGYPDAFGQYSTPPSSTAHQFALNGSYALAPKTRITARVSFSLELQNQPFLPYTDNPNLVVATPLPRSSLDGDIHHTFAQVTWTSHEHPKLELMAGYTFDDHDNHTPISLYTYVPNDVQDQSQPVLFGDVRYARYNLPHSFRFQHATADAAYRITPRTRFSLSYDGQFDWRNYQEVANTAENTGKAKISTSFTRGSLWAWYAFSERTGSNYNSAAAWNASHTIQYLTASPADASLEYPLLRKYNLADRKRNETKTGATFDATDALAIDLSATYDGDKYEHSLFGLQSSRSVLADVDLTYTIKDRLTASAFYTFERITDRQAGYYLASLSLTNPAQAWTAGNEDTIHSAGLRLDWQAIPEKLKLGISYNLSDASTHIPVAATPFISLAQVQPLPDVREITQDIGVHADYAVRPDLTLRAGYQVERHITTDWAYNQSLTPVAQILGSGIVAPRYWAHVIRVSTRYAF